MAANGYELIDAGGQEKLERFGDRWVRRPSAAAVWERRLPQEWKKAEATFQRDRGGVGKWSHRRGNRVTNWSIHHEGFNWNLHANEHGNVGIFAEQAPCWGWVQNVIERASRQRPSPPEVLNLFGYTGGSTLAAAKAGASVVHVDASKTSVQNARDNAKSSELEDRPIRWIVEDAVKFVDREIRRGRRYQGIILDPPSYGRGTGGEVWTIETDMLPLLQKCSQLIADDPCLFLLTSHSPGFTPMALRNLLPFGEHSIRDFTLSEGEMVVEDRGGRPLPSGAYARWERS